MKTAARRFRASRLEIPMDIKSTISAAEQKGIADIKAIYARLGDDARQEAAKAVSFAERHFGIVIAIVAGVCLALGFYARATI